MDAGTAVALAFTVALASLFFLLLGAVILRHCWRRGDDDGVPASTRRGGGGFVLFDVCFHDDRQRRAARPASSMERSRRRERGGDSVAAAADEQQEPDECEIARWKKIFGGPNRSLSTIDEGTEKGGTTAATTPAFCTPPASPDRRQARALDMASIAAQVKAYNS